MRNETRFLALGLLLSVVACDAQTGSRVPIVRPGSEPAAIDGTGRVDHSRFDDLLRRFVDERGRVDYAAWKIEGREELERYLRSMGAIRPARLADRNETFAYWINVYNALTIHGMLQFYPTPSIRKHVSRLGGFHFWKDVALEVDGERRSLDAIEHEILRPMGEPRIHFGIVCASLGCPRLLAEVYRGETVLEQLDRNARDFFAQPSMLRIDRESDTVYLSKILEWFDGDFGEQPRDRLAFVARYAPTDQDREFLESGSAAIRFQRYDWAINEQ